MAPRPRAAGVAAGSKCPPFAAPQPGSYASSVCAWWLWSARYSQARGRPTGRPATALGARASSLPVRPFPRLRPFRRGRVAACRTWASPWRTRPCASAAARGGTCALASLSPALSGVMRDTRGVSWFRVSKSAPSLVRVYSPPPEKEASAAQNAERVRSRGGHGGGWLRRPCHQAPAVPGRPCPTASACDAADGALA